MTPVLSRKDLTVTVSQTVVVTAYEQGGGVTSVVVVLFRVSAPKRVNRLPSQTGQPHALVTG